MVGMSFDAFLERTGLSPRKQSGYRCTICKLPEDLRNELRDLRSRPVAVSYDVLSQYLSAEFKVEVKQGTIAKHFREGHK